MALGDIEKKVKKTEQDRFRISSRVKEKIKDRDLNPETIVDFLKNKEFKGIINQDNNDYLIWLEYDNEHDLIIIVRFDKAYITIKTAFPQNIKRRVKSSWQ